MEKITFTPTGNTGTFSPELSNGQLVEVHIDGRVPRVERVNLVAYENAGVDPETGEWSFIDYLVILSNQVSAIGLSHALQYRPNLTFYKV